MLGKYLSFIVACYEVDLHPRQACIRTRNVSETHQKCIYEPSWWNRLNAYLMHFSMRITIRIICILMRIPKHFSKCVSHAHCMRFRNAHYGKHIRSASDAFQKCASRLSHFMRIWKRIWNASLMRIKRFKWNGLMRFQMRINVHREDVLSRKDSVYAVKKSLIRGIFLLILFR